MRSSTRRVDEVVLPDCITMRVQGKNRVNHKISGTKKWAETFPGVGCPDSHEWADYLFSASPAWWHQAPSRDQVRVGGASKEWAESGTLIEDKAHLVVNLRQQA